MGWRRRTSSSTSSTMRHAPLGRAVVAGVSGSGEEEALPLADRLERLPAHRLAAWRDEQDHRQRLFRIASGRNVQFILLLRGVVIFQPVGGRLGEALVRQGERPVQPRRRRDRHLGLVAVRRRGLGRRGADCQTKTRYERFFCHDAPPVVLLMNGARQYHTNPKRERGARFLIRNAIQEPSPSLALRVGISNPPRCCYGWPVSYRHRGIGGNQFPAGSMSVHTSRAAAPRSPYTNAAWPNRRASAAASSSPTPRISRLGSAGQAPSSPFPSPW